MLLCWRQQRLALQGCTSVQSLAIFGIGFSPCPLDATVCHMLLCWRQQRLALQGCTCVQSLPIIGVGFVPSPCLIDVALRHASMLASPIVSRVAVLSTSGELSATTLCSSFSETPSKASNLQQSEAAQFHLCSYRSQQRAIPRCSAAPLSARVRAQRLLEYLRKGFGRESDDRLPRSQ